MSRGRWNIVAIALLGLVLAIALGAFAHTIAGRTVALPATTLSTADQPLAPAQAKQARPGSKPKKKPKAPARTTPTTTTAPSTTTTDDDDRGRNRGRGSDDSSGSGSGSDNSGKGGGDDD